MRIVQVLPTLSPGGAEGFVTNLGVSLAELGAEVRFFLLAGVRGERGRVLFERLARVSIQVAGAQEHNVRSPWNVIRLAHLIRSWRPDITQANLYSAAVVTAVARGFATGSGVHYARRLTNTEQVGYRSKWIVQRMARAFDLTVACAPAVATAYRDFANGRAMGQLVTIANGGRLLEALPNGDERCEARQRLGISNGAFVVCHIGGMFCGRAPGDGLASGQKAHDVLLKSFAAAFGGNDECTLLLVGDGPLRAEAETLAEDLGIAQQTHFLGQQPEPWPAMKAADIFCFPSRYEGLPNVLPEAASCGLPVVASDIPEIREVCLGEGWLLRPVDDVAQFVEAMWFVRKNRAHFAGKARSMAGKFRERFSMRICAEKYLNAYARLLRGQ